MLVFKNVYYKIKNKTILDNISFVIKNKEKVLIMGKSGCGKSTIFNLILDNIHPTSGNIFYNNLNIVNFNPTKLNNYRQNDVIMIYQKDDLFDNLSVFDNLTMYYFNNDVNTILNKANLKHLKNRKVYSLSGGERQKIAILKACLSSCNILLCDEVTSALDEDSAKKMVDFILKLFVDKTIIFIGHDSELFDDKIDHYIYIEDHQIKKDITYETRNVKTELINNKTNRNKRKNLLFISILQGLKKIRLSSLLIYVLLVLCLYISINYKSIFSYFAYKSYSNYFGYDVLFIKDYNDKIDDKNIYFDLSDDFDDIETIINNKTFYDINFYPFYNKDGYSSLVVCDSLLEILNIPNIYNLSLSNGFSINQVDIIKQDNMFSIPCIFYDILFFQEYHLAKEKETYVIIDYDFTLKDDRFTNNPLFYEKSKDKPYLDNCAYNDYLTYQMVFDSIKSVVDYFFVIILLYSIICSILLNVSIMKKDIKQIAIFISRGYDSFQILLSYQIPLIIYLVISSISLFFTFDLLISIIIAYLLQLITIIISYFYIKSKPLHNLLKEDTLC